MLQRSIKSVCQETQQTCYNVASESVWQVTRDMLQPPAPPPTPPFQENHTILRAQLLTDRQNF